MAGCPGLMPELEFLDNQNVHSIGQACLHSKVVVDFQVASYSCKPTM